MRAHEPHLNQIGGDGFRGGTAQGGLHPGVAFDPGLALDENGTQLALGGEGLDRHLVGGLFRGVQPAEHLFGQTGGEVRKDFRGLHRRTLAAFTRDFKN